MLCADSILVKGQLVTVDRRFRIEEALAIYRGTIAVWVRQFSC